MTRKYGRWPGNEKGTPENETRCIAEVSGSVEWFSHQCQRKRGYGPEGLYCKQHAKQR